MHSDIERVASNERIDLSSLEKASATSSKDIREIRASLQKRFPIQAGNDPEIDLVLLGSYGREEATHGSDFDHLILLHASPTPAKIRQFIEEVRKIGEELELPNPGSSGLFGEIAIGSELYIRIGLESDTNTNTTRRLLLLTESVSAYSEEIHIHLLKKIIDRYCTDYEESETEHDPSRIPHFLMNDLVRYWRTIAVDFGAKKWRALTPNWHVRYAKLVTSRKLMFAGSLASIFLTRSTVQSGLGIKDHLFSEFRKPALARLAGLYEKLQPNGRNALAQVLTSYNAFIKILDDHGSRDFLEKMEPSRASEIRHTMMGIGDKIQESLEIIFYDDPLFKDLTRKYGLF